MCLVLGCCMVAGVMTHPDGHRPSQPHHRPAALWRVHHVTLVSCVVISSVLLLRLASFACHWANDREATPYTQLTRAAVVQNRVVSRRLARQTPANPPPRREVTRSARTNWAPGPKQRVHSLLQQLQQDSLATQHTVSVARSHHKGGERLNPSWRSLSKPPPCRLSHLRNFMRRLFLRVIQSRQLFGVVFLMLILSSLVSVQAVQDVSSTLQHTVDTAGPLNYLAAETQQQQRQLLDGMKAKPHDPTALAEQFFPRYKLSPPTWGEQSARPRAISAGYCNWSTHGSSSWHH